ncbi:tumor necrosis factor receptor superfamily, member a [Trichomycterus rosablanca]|uniref:tumor necrosis factor receptor superfamily, member a n=1 Tax=Trichomycterus rosablanca TaxID=2290929 RepID=UPI002F35587F
MSRALTMQYTVCLIILVLSVVSAGAAEPGVYLNQTARQLSCKENEEYPYKGFCCKNCEAGTFVREKCTADQEKGICEQCKAGTYAEHPTGMEQCLQCSQCHADQKMTKNCTHMHNTQCECKPGLFCLPDQPCEVCKKCTKCKADEIEEQKCTPTSNTKCKKRQSPLNPTEPPTVIPEAEDAGHTGTLVIVFVVLFFLALLVVSALVWKWRRHHCVTQESTVAQNDEVKIPIDDPSSEERQNCRNAGLEEAELPPHEFRPLLQETQGHGKSVPVEDEDRGLGDSLPNTTSSSQTSLSALPVTAVPSTAANSEMEAESWARDDGTTKRLVPLLGEEVSLSKSFDLFDELNVRIHNKFFRSIGVSDNAIKLAESQSNGDKVYDLLRNWMQREGLRANINYLLQALLDLDQRYSAEQIASRAVERGYYKYE